MTFVSEIYAVSANIDGTDLKPLSHAEILAPSTHCEGSQFKPCWPCDLQGKKLQFETNTEATSAAQVTSDDQVSGPPAGPTRTAIVGANQTPGCGTE